MSKFTDAELEAYLDEALPPDLMSRIEQTLRSEQPLMARLIAISGRRDSGQHSLGDIWRRHRISCPTREQLGSYLLNALEPEFADYIRLHLEVVGCRLCLANFHDLDNRRNEKPEASHSRRRKYFQSSAGHLPRK